MWEYTFKVFVASEIETKIQSLINMIKQDQFLEIMQLTHFNITSKSAMYNPVYNLLSKVLTFGLN